MRKPPGTNPWLRLSWESATPSNRVGALSSVLHVWCNAWQPPPNASRHQRIWLTIASILGDRVDVAGAPGWNAQVPFRWPVKSRTARGARRGSGGQLASAIVDLLAAAAATNDSPLRPKAIDGRRQSRAKREKVPNASSSKAAFGPAESARYSRRSERPARNALFANESLLTYESPKTSGSNTTTPLSSPHLTSPFSCRLIV